MYIIILTSSFFFPFFFSEAHHEYDREIAKAFNIPVLGGLRGRTDNLDKVITRTLPVFPSTEVFILGTAGLRLLTQKQEDVLFDAVVKGLNDRRGPVSTGGQPFMIRRHQVIIYILHHYYYYY